MPPVTPASTLAPKNPATVEPDAHGQAALLLTESLIHALVDNATLTTAEAVEVVTIAAEVNVEIASLAGESQGRMRESLALLSKMAESFEVDRSKGS
jgi:hypothetical protein